MDMKAFKRIYKYRCDGCGKFSQIKRRYCRICGAQALRKARKDDYRIVAKDVMEKQRESLQARTKMKGMINKQRQILEALLQNEEEYKNLLKRQRAGEDVEDLISNNRANYDILKKEDREHSEIALNWGRSEEGRKMFALMDRWARMSPERVKKTLIKRDIGLMITSIKNKIQKNKDEYDDLLERNNKGQYVDDLISQNRYTAQKLEQDRIKIEDMGDKLGVDMKPDWKRRIKN
ncbi:MAG: hypothetical protein ACW96X_02765 [Promethearchaeota archaeon]